MANKCANNSSNNIIKNIIQQTPSKVCVLLRKTFFHTPDEARSVGLVKACVLSKSLFCYREISFNISFLLFCTQNYRSHDLKTFTLVGDAWRYKPTKVQVSNLILKGVFSAIRNHKNILVPFASWLVGW